MSLKCSVLGHRFGETSVERSREESGNEVVITEQEVRTCERCGHQRVVSENKEVTTREPADDGLAGTDKSTSPGRASSTQTDTPVDEPDPQPVDETAPSPGVENGTDGGGTAAPGADDGVILEPDEESEPDHEPGAWPEEPEDDGPEWTPPDLREEPSEEPDLTVEPTGEAVTVPEGVYRCGSCGYTTPVESSSLREGDFCPECHTGALAHERGSD